MANSFPLIPSAKIMVKRSAAGAIPAGRGVRLTGGLSAENIPLVAPPSGADGRISGVTIENDIDDANAGFMVLAGLSPVLLRIGSVGVTKNDPLRIQDNTGVWETAPLLSQNVHYYALQTVAAGAMCAAEHASSRPL